MLAIVDGAARIFLSSRAAMHLLANMDISAFETSSYTLVTSPVKVSVYHLQDLKEI